MTKDGELKEVELKPGLKLKGKELMYQTGMLIRSAFQVPTDEEGEEERDYAIDYFLYLWCGPNSPLFDKDKMATFERYFMLTRRRIKRRKAITSVCVTMRK